MNISDVKATGVEVGCPVAAERTGSCVEHLVSTTPVLVLESVVTIQSLAELLTESLEMCDCLTMFVLDYSYLLAEVTTIDVL